LTKKELSSVRSYYKKEPARTPKNIASTNRFGEDMRTVVARPFPAYISRSSEVMIEKEKRITLSVSRALL
jgi:hypothetical protein